MLRVFLLLTVLANAYALDCYAPGTKSTDEENNCVCKYGYYGLKCTEIHQCLAGAPLLDIDCFFVMSRKDLQNLGAARCSRLQRSHVKICDCPIGFGGETCDYILRDTIDTWLRIQETSDEIFQNPTKAKNVQFITSLSQCIAVFIYVLMKNIWKLGVILIVIGMVMLMNRRRKPTRNIQIQRTPRLLDEEMAQQVHEPPPAYSDSRFVENEQVVVAKVEEVIFHTPRLHV